MSFNFLFATRLHVILNNETRISWTSKNSTFCKCPPSPLLKRGQFNQFLRFTCLLLFIPFFQVCIHLIIEALILIFASSKNTLQFGGYATCLVFHQCNLCNPVWCMMLNTFEFFPPFRRHCGELVNVTLRKVFIIFLGLVHRWTYLNQKKIFPLWQEPRYALIRATVSVRAQVTMKTVPFDWDTFINGSLQAQLV